MWTFFAEVIRGMCFAVFGVRICQGRRRSYQDVRLSSPYSGYIARICQNRISLNEYASGLREMFVMFIFL